MTKQNQITDENQQPEKKLRNYFGWKTKVAAGAFALLTAYSSAFTIKQSDQAIITRMGRPVAVVLNPLENSQSKARVGEIRREYEKQGVAVSDGAGLHFKLPYVDTVRTLDRRLLRWNGYPEQINTFDKRFIWVDATARWYIEDPLKFYKALQTVSAGMGKLDDIIDGEVRNVVTGKNLIELVRTDNREMRVSDPELKSTTEVDKVTEGRDKVVKEITYRASQRLSGFGIGLHPQGVMLKEIIYVDDVKKSVEDRMTEERLRIAKKYQSEGEGEYARIMGERDREVARIQSEAYKIAEETKGLADGKATDIYAEAYGKDPSFYDFSRKMELYKTSLPKQNVVIGIDNEVFRELKGPHTKSK